MSFDPMQNLSPLLIPLLAMTIPIVAIVAAFLYKSSRDRERHQTIREFIKAGQPVPPELLAGDAQDSDWGRERRAASYPNRSLVVGVVNLSAGLGLMGMFFLMMPGAWLWGIGLIPAFLGIGFLLLWNFERTQQQPRP